MATVCLGFDRVPGNFKEFGGTDGQDWYSRHRDYPIVDLDGYICGIQVVGTAEGLYPDDQGGKIRYVRGSGVYTLAGSAFHIGRGRFVTAAHVVQPAIVEIYISKYVSYVVPVDKVLTRVITIGNGPTGKYHAILSWVDHESDLAIVEVPFFSSTSACEPVFTSQAIAMGFNVQVVDRLKPGVVVAMVVRQRVDPDKGELGYKYTYEVRYGKIVASGPWVPGKPSNHEIAWFSPYDVTMDTRVYPGDSGSPVFAFEDGKPVLIGVARAIARVAIWDEELGLVWKELSYFARIDLITRKFLEVCNERAS